MKCEKCGHIIGLSGHTVKVDGITLGPSDADTKEFRNWLALVLDSCKPEKE